MSPKVQQHLERAEYCERMASTSNDFDVKSSFREAAEQWRNLARQQERMEKSNFHRLTQNDHYRRSS